MASIAGLLRLAWRALLFDGDAYQRMDERPRAVYDGALFVLLLGVGLWLAGTAGAIVARGAAPEGGALARALERGLAGLPALQGLGTLAGGWLAGLVRRREALAPLLQGGGPAVGLVLGWLSFGALVQRGASWLGGRSSLQRTLACTALAEAPRALLLVPVLPPLGAAGLGVWAWVLAARFQALRRVHGLDGWLTFWLVLAVEALLAAAGLSLTALALSAWRVG